MANWFKHIFFPSVLCGILTGLGTAVYCLEVGLPRPKPELMVALPAAKSKALDAWVQSRGISPRNCVVEFGDFQCPYCRKATIEIRVLKAGFGSKDHFIFGHFPLEGHQFANYAAVVDVIAAKCGEGKEMFCWLMATRDLRPKAIQAEAMKLGIPKHVLESKGVGSEAEAEVKDSLKVGNEIGVDSIPSFFYVDRGGRVSRALSISALQEALSTSAT